MATAEATKQNAPSEKAGTSKVPLIAHAPMTRDEELTYAMAAARRTERRRIVSFVRLCDSIIASSMRAMLNRAAQLALDLSTCSGVPPSPPPIIPVALPKCEPVGSIICGAMTSDSSAISRISHKILTQAIQ